MLPMPRHKRRASLSSPEQMWKKKRGQPDIWCSMNKSMKWTWIYPWNDHEWSWRTWKTNNENLEKIHVLLLSFLGFPDSRVKSTLQSLESDFKNSVRAFMSLHMDTWHAWRALHDDSKLHFITISYFFMMISRFLSFQVISWHFDTDLPLSCLCRPSWAETLAHTSEWIGTRWSKKLQPSIPASKGPPSTIPFPKPDKSPQLPTLTSPGHIIII